MKGKFEIKGKNGKFYWSLIARNGQTIANGTHGYATKAACQNAIESVRKHSFDAEVEDI